MGIFDRKGWVHAEDADYAEDAEQQAVNRKAEDNHRLSAFLLKDAQERAAKIIAEAHDKAAIVKEEKRQKSLIRSGRKLIIDEKDKVT